MVILALMVVRFILRVFAAHFYLALPDLLRRMCLPRSIISLRRDGQLQRNVVRPPGTGAAGGEINRLLGRICGRFADNSGPRATELRGVFWFPCFELMR